MRHPSLILAFVVLFLQHPCNAAQVPLQNARLTGSTVVASGTLSITGSSALISGSNSTVDLRLGTVYLPSVSGSSNALTSGTITGSTVVASGTLAISGSSTLLSGSNSMVDLRLGTIYLPTVSLTTGVSGTLQAANFPAALPALNGGSLTDLNAASISTGTVSTARLPVFSGTASPGIVVSTGTDAASKVLYGNGTWAVPPGATGGEANTAANLGTDSDGVGIYGTKSGVELGFKRLKAGSGVSLSATTNFITITASGGSGSSTDSPDNFPASPTLYDEEFTTALSGSWSWLPASSGTMNAVSVVNGKLLFRQNAANPPTTVRVLWKPSPGQAFTVVGKVFLPFGPTGNIGRAGICVGNSANSRIFGVELERNATTLYLASVNVDLSTLTLTNVGSAIGFSQMWIYLKIVYDGTNLTSSYSLDGSIYRQHATQTVASYVGAIDRIGIHGGYNATVSGDDFQFTTDFVRLTQP